MTSLAASVLNHHDIDYIKIERIHTGLFNTTFKIIRKNPEKSLIIRIAPDENVGTIFYEKNMMKREPEIHHQILHNTNIPIPKILKADFSHTIIPQNYLIMEFMDGQPMSDAAASPLQQNNILTQTGAYLRQLHESVVSDSFGYPGNDCMEKQATWHDAFIVMWSKLIDDITACGVYDQSENHFAKKVLKKNIGSFIRDVKACLLHMDIWSQNILLNDNKQISAILDWDRALYGDPEIEFAVLDYVGFMSDSFRKGYGDFPKQTNDFKIRQTFYYLYEFQKYLVIWTIRRPNRTMVNNYKNYALSTLRNIN